MKGCIFTKMVEINCVTCNKEFSVFPCQIKQGAKCCSVACMGVYRTQNFYLDCAYCEKEFKTIESLANKGRTYCSWKCYSKGRIKNVK